MTSLAPTASSPLRPTLTSLLRPDRGRVLLGLGLGLAATLLLDGAPAGLSHGLFAALLAAVLARHAGREAWQSAGPHRWLLAGAVALVASSALHATAWLAALNTVAALLLLGVAVQGWPGERPLGALGAGQLLGWPLKTAGQALHAGAVASSEALARLREVDGVRQIGAGAVRLVGIVTPPVALVTVLLAAGDARFGALVEGLRDALLQVQVGPAVRGTFLTLVSAVVLTGLLALAARRRQLVSAAAPARRLRAIESFVLLGTLTAVLLSYGLTVAAPEGGYARAAHQGFFPLLFAALVILALLMALPARTLLGTARAERTFTALATSLVLATLPMVVSAVARLWRYQAVYGLTVLRVLAGAGLLLVAALLTWRAVTLWVAQAQFVAGALGLCTATLLGLAALSPEALIAQTNLRREEVDVAYLLSLSDDAVPAVIASLARFPEWQQAQVQEHLEARRRSLGDEAPSFTWNLGRSRARRALAQAATLTP